MSESTEFNREQESRFSQRAIEEFRSNGGKVGGPLEGFDLLLLHNVGAESALPCISPVRYFDIDGSRYIVGSAAGRATHPEWVVNIRANPGVRIELGGDDIVYGHAQEVHGEDRDRIVNVIKQRVSGFAGYDAATRRTIPVFELRTIRLSV